MNFRNLPSGLSLQELIEWIESLAEGEESHRQNILKFNDAVKDLISYGESALESLIDRLLHTESRWMRWAAIWTLGHIGDKRAIQPLWNIYHTSEDDIEIQIDVLIALSKLQAEGLFEILVPLLNHENWNLRRAAINALGHLGDQRAIDILLPLLQYPNYENLYIVNALGSIGGSIAVRALEDIINAEDLQPPESSQHDRLRCDAVNALAQIDDPNTIPVLQAALNHRKRGVRRHARKALAKRLNQE